MDLNEQVHSNEDIDDESTSSSNDSSDDESDNERIVKAVAFKEQGNNFFQCSAFMDAKEQYELGLKTVQKFEYIPGEGQLLYLSINLNLAAVYNKLEQYYTAIRHLNDVLKIDESNVKALYRRGVALSRNGDFLQARDDFLKLLKQDPENKDAKRELLNIKQRSEKHKIEEKKRFQGVFARVNVYEDKEQERLERLQREKEAYEKLKNDWEIENNRRHECGEEEISFEDFKKRIDEQNMKESKERQSVPPSPSRISSTKENVETNEELDEEESKLIEETKKKGYCYFRREQTEIEKQLIGDVAPKKLGTDISNQISDQNILNSNCIFAKETDLSTSTRGIEHRGSAWNIGGTWEESDMSAVAKQALEKSLQLAKWQQNEIDDNNSSSKQKEFENQSLLLSQLTSIEAKVKSIKKCNGDASICVVRGSKRYVYDFTVELEWEVILTQSFDSCNEMQNENNNFSNYSGSLTISDINSTVKSNEIEFQINFDEMPIFEHSQVVNQALEYLKESIRSRIQQFEIQYHQL